jgi:cyclic dehypoxanthinyl futalosine synthase
VALVPVAAYAAHPEWEVVPEVGIGCRGPVLSVVLVAEVPLEQIARVHLDGASRTSALLIQLLLAARGVHPEFVPAPHREGRARVRGRDAALIIGDAALGLSRPHVHDLGNLWQALTGLPFVFAFWAARPGLLDPRPRRRPAAGPRLRPQARRGPRPRLPPGPPRRRRPDVLSENAYANYLRRSIRYSLSTKEREGLVEFLTRARDAGLVQIPGLARRHHPRPLRRRRPPRGPAVARRRARRCRSTTSSAAPPPAAASTSPRGSSSTRTPPSWTSAPPPIARRQTLHPDGVVTYIVDRNVNYTNVCVTRCKFCNFYTHPAPPAATS